MIAIYACDSGGGEGGEDADNEANPGRQEWLAADSHRRLEIALSYLRETHLYCVYCGCDYPSAEAMLEGCPGPEEDLH